MSKIKRFFEFFYAFPTSHMRELPYDRIMILPSTILGATMGATWQSLALAIGYSYFKEASLNNADYAVIGGLSLVPITTNIISGIVEKVKEKKGSRKDPRVEALLKKGLEELTSQRI